MKKTDYEKMIDIDVPNDLDIFIEKGLKKGKKTMRRRRNIKNVGIGMVATFALFVGSINVSPTFANSLKDIEVVGTLVKKLQWNDGSLSGGSDVKNAKASIKLEKDKDKERLVLSFNNKDAGLYNATLSHFPETVTISLPGTEKINIMGDVERSKDASSYIKSIYSLSENKGNNTYLQIEFDDSTDVSVEEYKNPGQIVINLKPGKFDGRDIYSVRTLSFKNKEDLDKIIKNVDSSKYRLLRDDKASYFVEFAQFDKEEDANKAKDKFGVDTIVEKRWSNNVPVEFLTNEAYRENKVLNEYNDILMNSTEIQDVLNYLDANLNKLSDEGNETLLKGLTGYIKDDYKNYDLNKLNKYYKMMDKDIYKELGINK